MENITNITLGNHFMMQKENGKNIIVEIDSIQNEVDNFVYLKGFKQKVNFKRVKPIPLSSELFLKMGLKHSLFVGQESYSKDFGGYHFLFVNAPKGWFLQVSDTYEGHRRSIGSFTSNYVHQAENLAKILGVNINFELPTEEF